MIFNAYETKTNFLSNEIIKLSKDLEKKQNKINEFENFCQKLLNQKNFYENNINNLSNENEKLKEHLNNVLIENNELKKVKQNILATIENNNNSIQIKNNSNSLEQIYKNNNYNILNKRNKLKEDYNKNNINNKSFGLNYYSERLFKTTLKKGKIPINVNFINQNNKFINNNNNSVSNENIKNRKMNKSFSLEKMLNKTYYKKNLTNKNSPNRFNYINNSFSQKNINENNNNSNENNFFKKCRETMSSTDYVNMLDIVYMFNSKQINKQDTYTNILEILQ